ncbi:MAG: putative sulfate exporter family transporter, partial [Pseudolabrys sp.]
MTTAATTWNEATPRRADNVEIAPRLSEDWLSLIIGLFIFVLALAGIANVDLLGWVVTTSVWNDIGKALGTVSKSYASLGGFGALVATYLALLVVLSAAAVALKSELKKFALAFTAVFWVAYASWVIGNFANFAAVTPADLQKFGLSWSLRLKNEGAYIFALIAGLVIANVF